MKNAMMTRPAAAVSLLFAAALLLLPASHAAPVTNNNQSSSGGIYVEGDDQRTELGDVTYGGSGCREGSATLTTSGPRYTLQFHNYSAAIHSTGSRRERKTCNVIIPVEVPPNRRLAVPGMFIGGKAAVPEDASAFGEARAEYFFAGNIGPAVERTFQPGFNGEWGASEGHWVLTDCGGSTNFRVSSSIQARSMQGTGVDLQTMSFEFLDVEC